MPLPVHAEHHRQAVSLQMSEGLDCNQVKPPDVPYRLLEAILQSPCLLQLLQQALQGIEGASVSDHCSVRQQLAWCSLWGRLTGLEMASASWRSSSKRGCLVYCSLHCDTASMQHKSGLCTFHQNHLEIDIDCLMGAELPPSQLCWTAKIGELHGGPGEGSSSSTGHVRASSSGGDRALTPRAPLLLPVPARPASEGSTAVQQLVGSSLQAILRRQALQIEDKSRASARSGAAAFSVEPDLVDCKLQFSQSLRMLHACSAVLNLPD